MYVNCKKKIAIVRVCFNSSLAYIFCMHFSFSDIYGVIFRYMTLISTIIPKVFRVYLFISHPILLQFTTPFLKITGLPVQLMVFFFVHRYLACSRNYIESRYFLQRLLKKSEGIWYVIQPVLKPRLFKPMCLIRVANHYAHLETMIMKMPLRA